MVGSRVSNRVGQSRNVSGQIEMARPQAIIPLSREKILVQKLKCTFFPIMIYYERNIK